MGHVRVGRLPKTRKWRQVVSLLHDPSASVADVASATLKAASSGVSILRHDPALSYCYWLLTQITSTAKDEGFYHFLDRIGIQIHGNDPALDFLSQLSAHVSRVVSTADRSVFSEISEQAFTQVLTEAVRERASSIFGTTAEDVRLACRSLATKTQFGDLPQSFFGKLLSRYLQYFISKEISNQRELG